MTSEEPDSPAHTRVRTVAELGEDGVIALATGGVRPDPRVPVGPGDDAAVVVAPDGRTVVSSDALVEGRHFRFELTTPEHVGRRAIAQNAADIAAMGAVCTAFTVTLGCPSETGEDVIAGIARGTTLGAAEAGGAIAGGDVVRTDQVLLAVTVLGDLQGREPVLLSGARPGDVVAVRGTLGHSAAGLDVLLAGYDGFDGLVETYRCPAPPLAAGPQAADAGATALTDVSDGLLRDARALARASGVTIALDGALLAPDAELTACAAALGADAGRWVRTGGEDHALLATFPAGSPLPGGWRAIGTAAEPGERPAGTVTVDGDAGPAGGGWNTFTEAEEDAR
ncbi:thiamine-phosphate kinase [Tsukamurella paurometabola]|uniref:Thiamine-monophosphate kinase n=1 Tax=Tsukamurella paurometabola TaxID=2061 RepID=A0ABS5NDH6_TSUPA|nr:thiamine-phosphate kinase [Tsukamurella paurometabola]MBS4102003.1 thiamine-phosphate kinase [Tsukamurella paurometabola]